MLLSSEHRWMTREGSPTENSDGTSDLLKCCHHRQHHHHRFVRRKRKASQRHIAMIDLSSLRAPSEVPLLQRTLGIAGFANHSDLLQPVQLPHPLFNILTMSCRLCPSPVAFLSFTPPETSAATACPPPLPCSPDARKPPLQLGTHHHREQQPKQATPLLPRRLILWGDCRPCSSCKKRERGGGEGTEGEGKMWE